jgi:hypothetical protein
MTMTQALLAPLFLHVLLTFAVGATSLRARFAAVKSGRTRLKEIATSADGWPPEVRKLGNNFDNQFQTPLFWYGVCALLVATNLVDGVTAGLSWLFLATRIAHSAIHMGRNIIMQRLVVFVIGFASLILMWAWFGLRLFLIG